MRPVMSLLVLSFFLPMINGQDGTASAGSGFATLPSSSSNIVPDSPLPGTIVGTNTFIPAQPVPLSQPGLNINFNLQATNAPQNVPAPVPDGRIQPVPEKEPLTPLQRFYQDNLFNYTWIDFGENPGLRINRLEMTNAWADMRSADFFTRPFDSTEKHFNAGLSFGVQWWKDQFGETPVPNNFQLPPVLYDLYLDLGWRAMIAPNWLIDLAISPGLSTDFRVTPPDGVRLRGHAITMVDMLPNLRGVLGIWYPNWNTTKILPVAGFSWQATETTRVEAIFPQPRIVQTLGCWKGSTWEFSLGGEYGGGGWAFKDSGNDRETINYSDFRVLAGIACNGTHGQAQLQAGYVFSRQLQYGTLTGLDYDPGNAWMIRVSWDY